MLLHDHRCKRSLKQHILIPPTEIGEWEKKIEEIKSSGY